MTGGESKTTGHTGWSWTREKIEPRIESVRVKAKSRVVGEVEERSSPRSFDTLHRLIYRGGHPGSLGVKKPMAECEGGAHRFLGETGNWRGCVLFPESRTCTLWSSSVSYIYYVVGF